MFSLLEKSGLSRYFFAINGKILEILYIFLKKMLYICMPLERSFEFV